MKILASDMDGTLVIENEINPKDIEAINNLKSEGHKFVVSTGRTLRGMGNIFSKHELPYDYMVLCNGALILDKDKKVIYKNTIDREKIRKVIETFKQKRNLVMYMDDGENFYIIKNDNVIKDPEVEDLTFFEEIGYILISAEDAIKLDTDFIMASVFATDRSVERAIKAQNVLDMLLDKGEHFRNDFFVDIVPAGCSKGEGLKQLLKIENKELKDLYTIGDSFNDISMFEITENSYTFNRAEEEVRKHAKNSVDYIYEVIEKIIE